MSEVGRDEREVETAPTAATPSGGRTMARGAMIGGAAAVIVALGDFGATWLWLPLWTDRAELLARLLSTMVPLGAAAGALLAGYGRVTGRLRLLGRSPRAERRRWPLPYLGLAAAPLGVVGHLLFTGGRMAQLPARGALAAGATVALLAALYVALRLGRALFLRGMTGGRARGIAIALLFLGGYVGASKLDQSVLPNLYQYLHALLAVTGFLLAATAVALLGVHSPSLRRLEARGPAWGVVAVMVLAAVLTLDVLTLDRNQNVRVALFDARAASSRSLLLGLEPLLTSSGAQTLATREAIDRARRERERRQELIDRGELPTWSGAHVLMITIDALRADHLGAYGYARDTSPHLDALAADSILFERPYAQAPHSSYSLGSLMTSEYLHEIVDLGKPLPEATLAKSLGEGYHTAAFFTLGIFHTEGERLGQYRDEAFGFARHDHSDVQAARKTEQVLEEIDRIAAMGEPPSLMWVHYFDVHEPYRDTYFGTSDIDRYDSEIRKVDAEVGRLLAEARARLERDMIVVISADHGEEFRDHGGVYHGSTLFDEQIRVPLILHAPGLAARRVPAPVELVDVAPTLLGMLDRPVPPSMRGDDLRPLALGNVDTTGPAFAGVTYKRMVVRWPYKLIADLRFNLFQIYDLSTDLRERTNLANQRPELLEELKGEVYAWIDTLGAPPGGDAVTDPRLLAFERGRLRDRRAAGPLGQLVQDEDAPLEMRREAARILGQLADREAAPHLLASMRSPEPLVAAEAAIALGRMYDERARDKLTSLVQSEDPDLRVRAAVSLGRLRDRAAVPALVEALWVAPSTYEREEAVRWLGRLRDERAVEPLLALVPEFRIRDLSVVALGTIGDRRAYEPLADMLDWEHHTGIRDNVIRGLGQLGDPRAVPLLVAVATHEPDLENTSESLVRLGAIEAGAIGGADVGPRLAGAQGLGGCEEGPPVHDWSYRHRTWCETRRAEVRVPLRVPGVLRRSIEGVSLVVRARRADQGAPTELFIALGDAELGSVPVDGQWHEHRLAVPAEALPGDRATARLRPGAPGARVRLDHLLLVPSPPQVAAAE